MIKYYQIILVLLCTTTLFSQKVMEKQLDISNIERIEFLADAVFKIKVSTVKSSSLTLRASVAGENAENVVIDIKRTVNSIVITPGFTPFFKQENDKLAAHKVMAIELEVLLPENLNVSVFSKLASLECFGKFKYFQTYLEQGTCDIKNFNGDGLINTKNGNITASVLQSVGVVANSKYGSVTSNPYQKGYYKLEINSVSGDITILETN